MNDPLGDYGEGKTREQEATDSNFMLGIMLLVVVAVLFVVAGILIGHYLL